MALSPSHGQCVFSFTLPHLNWIATKLSHIVKMVLLLSCSWVCFIREQHCVCFLRGGGACACVSKSACAFVVVSVCCHELL